MIDSITFTTLDDDAVPPKQVLRVAVTEHGPRAVATLEAATYDEDHESRHTDTLASFSVSLPLLRDALAVLEAGQLPLPEDPLAAAVREAFKYAGSADWPADPDPQGPPWRVGDKVTVTHGDGITMVSREPQDGKGDPLSASDQRPVSLYDEIKGAINRHSAENESNTPDFVLAGFITDALAAYDRAVRQREEWYGRSADDGPAEAPDVELGR